MCEDQVGEQPIRVRPSASQFVNRLQRPRAFRTDHHELSTTEHAEHEATSYSQKPPQINRLQGEHEGLGRGDVGFGQEGIEMAIPSRSLIAVVAGFLIWEMLALVLGNQPNSTKLLQLATRRNGDPTLIQSDRHVVVTDDPTD
jgi:hypothetical protein